MNALLAISWEPELRGILIVIIAFVTLCGSIYLVLATNLGVRLGFLVAFTGLAGWMALMGSIWWVYGIGLKGPEPSWDAIPGQTVIQDIASLRNAGVLDTLPDDPRGCLVRARRPSWSAQQFVDEGWGRIEESEPTFGQAGSAAGELLVETDTFANGEFKVDQRLRHGRRALPEDQRQLRFPRLLPPTSLRGRRGRPARTAPGRTRPGADATRDRLHPSAPVRVHGPQSRCTTTTSCLDHAGIDHDVLVALLDAAPARPGRRREPQPTTGAGGLTRWTNTGRSRRCSILAVLFSVLSFVASRLLAPRRPSAAKEAPYECGIVPSREPPERFPVSFYIVAMLFIMFDIEIVFLYPYSVERGTLGVFGFWAIAGFSVIFFLTFVYEVARGGLDWGPLHDYRNLEADAAMVTPERTAASTIRRVGTEGRVGAGGAGTGEAA